jgi:hypothetical protein
VDGEQLGVDDGGEHQLVGPAGDGAERGQPQRRQGEYPHLVGQRGASGGRDRRRGSHSHLRLAARPTHPRAQAPQRSERVRVQPEAHDVHAAPR